MNARYHIPFVANGSYPVRTGNLVRPLVDGVPAFRRICDAVEAARHSVWLSVTFYAPDFQMPDGRGSLFDVLDRAAARGLHVRAMFWRPNPESMGYGRTFPGTPEDHALLRARGAGFRIRWDRAPAAFCQHQKFWLIDAGTPSETAFVGGINLTAIGQGAPGHREGGRHDAYVEITGPSATDVQHNFVQRWNEASERTRADGVFAHAGHDDLPFPAQVSAARGATPVQIQRNIHAGRYTHAHATPGGEAYDIAAGEHSVVTQYVQAIDAAQRTIYIENQAAPIPLIATRLEQALKRGVAVVALVPADPESHVAAARRNPARKAHFDQLAALGRYGHFTLAGIAALDATGQRRPIYVHAKLMLVDDVWATIGSCNLHSNSLTGHSELNASFFDPDIVRALRCELLAEHLAQDTSDRDDGAALALYQRIARQNAAKRAAGDADWQGLAFQLDPATYGE